ncbi:chemokine XC receptor 1-like [Erpetoichthys calabaricus]|uniref:X-C motif chemokine receptor 1 n=1 Tax=Erpetoichthys calabaricus TaxID=27687 RepID=A0A8C4RPW3_ERPCA|nr:chemokine XC receptor 1-like [Erpetoichthys calabaricus]
MDSESTTPPSYDGIEEVCQKKNVQDFGLFITVLIFSVVIVLSLMGNLLVVWILLRYEKRKTVTNIFILNLAISDLLFTFSLPFISLYQSQGWTLGNSMCKIVNGIFYIGFYSGIILMTIMSINRYVAVVHPLADLRSRKGCYGTWASMMIWLVSILASTPSIIFTSELQGDYLQDKSHCDYYNPSWKIVGTYQQNAFFLITLTVIVYCYMRILLRLLQSKTQKRYRTVKLIFTVVAIFFIGWAPFNIVIFLQNLIFHEVEYFLDCAVNTNLDYVFYVCRIFAFSHCCLNPIFYAFVGIKFKNHLKKVLRGCHFDHSTGDQNQHHTRVNFISSGEELSL